LQVVFENLIILKTFSIKKIVIFTKTSCKFNDFFMPAISEKLFRITLTNEYNGNFIILPNDMIGWDSLKIVLERDYDTFGFNQFFEGSFTFITEGRKFISDLYNQYFIEAKIQLKIEVLMPNFAAGNYITIGVGRLNLSDLSKSRHLENRSLAEEEGDQFLDLSCKIDMSGFAQNIQNNNEKLFDVDFTTSIESQDLLTYPADKFGFELPLHSKALFLEGEVQGAGGYNVNNDFVALNRYYSYNLELDNISIDEFIDSVITTPTILSDYFNTINVDNNNEVDGTPNKEQELFANFISNNTQTYTIRITGEITLSVGSATNVNRYFYLYLWDSESENVVLIATATVLGNGIDTQSIDFETNLNLPLGSELKVWARIESDPIGGSIVQMLHNLTINITSQTFEQSTTTKAYLIYELLDKVLSFNTSKNDVLRSSFFGRLDSFPRTYTGENSPSKLAITNGALLRKFADYQNVTITLKQFLEDLQTIFCIGWSVENESGNIADPQNLRVEFIDYFFQLGLVFKFANPDDLNFQVPTQFLQNRYEFGYKKYEDDFESTLDDTHTKRNYNNHLTAIKNGVSYLSELIASSYAIENARRQSFDIKPKESFKYDEDNFVIQCARGQFKVVIVGFIDDKIIIRRGSVIADLASFTSFGVVGCTIFNAGANNGIYNVSSYEQTDTPNDFSFEQRLVLAAFVSTPADLQDDSYALISTSLDKFFPEQDQNFTVQNLIDPASAYNLRITPNRNLMRWFRFWKTSFYKYPAQFFKFVKGIQNYKLITNLIGTNNTQFEDPNREISENENFVASDDKQAILPPSKITFNHPVNIENFAFILRDANRYKEYNVTTDGKSFYQGFLDRISYDPYNQLAEISLIAELKETSEITPPAEPPAVVSQFPCNSVVKSGGKGITTIRVNLDAAGGVLAFGLDTFQIPDKVEGIWNNTKVFTSGMFGIDNSVGPFDDGTIQNSTPPQYIGSLKGVIPNRISEFELDTGLTAQQIGYINSGYVQLVWFKYTPADFIISPFLDLVVTGFGGTEWTIKRFCQVVAPTPNPAANFSNAWNGGATPQIANITPASQSQVDTLNLSVGDSVRIQVFYNGIWHDETKIVQAIYSGGFDMRFLPNFTFLGVQQFIGTVIYARARNITKSGVYVDLGREIPAMYPI
jgi:hypothetical protein